MAVIKDAMTMFELIAKTHSGIGHAPDADPPVNRFYGYNMDESNAGDRDDLFFPRMGMATKAQGGINGRYENLLGSVRKYCYIEITLIDVPAEDDDTYEGEYKCYDRMEKVMDDMETWMLNAVTTDLKFKYPVLSYLDPGKITFMRIANATQASGFGVKMTIPIIEELEYDENTNPLAALDT